MNGQHGNLDPKTCKGSLKRSAACSEYEYAQPSRADDWLLAAVWGGSGLAVGFALGVFWW